MRLQLIIFFQICKQYFVFIRKFWISIFFLVRLFSEKFVHFSFFFFESQKLKTDIFSLCSWKISLEHLDYIENLSPTMNQYNILFFFFFSFVVVRSKTKIALRLWIIRLRTITHTDSHTLSHTTDTKISIERRLFAHPAALIINCTFIHLFDLLWLIFLIFVSSPINFCFLLFVYLFIRLSLFDCSLFLFQRLCQFWLSSTAHILIHTHTQYAYIFVVYVGNNPSYL